MPQLNDEAKSQVRKYMLTIVALPGIAISVASAIGGYLIHAHGEREAYVDSLKKFTEPVMASANAAASAQAFADSARKQIDIDAAQIRELRKQVESSVALASADQAIGEIVTKLLADPGFAERIAKVTSARLDAVQTSVDAIGRGEVTKELAITNPSTEGPDEGSCPQGSYVASIHARLGVTGKYGTDGIKQLVFKCRSIR